MIHFTYPMEIRMCDRGLGPLSILCHADGRAVEMKPGFSFRGLIKGRSPNQVLSFCQLNCVIVTVTIH